jgi:hypothetical protein
VGLIHGLLGNATQISPQECAGELGGVLAQGEQVQLAFRIIRDLIVFTSGRMLIVDKQGVTGKRVEYLSIPYRAITRFSVETAGRLDLDSELRIWVSGASEPITRPFSAGSPIIAVQQALAWYVCR